MERVQTGGNSFIVAEVDLETENVRVLLRGSDGDTIGTFTRLRKQLGTDVDRLAFAMNAGMFHASREPVGLLVSDGKELNGIETGEGKGNFYLKPNGVFFISNGVPRVRTTEEFVKLKGRAISQATQSGPILVRSGKVHSAFNETSKSRHIRNGIGVQADGTVCMVISENPVTFWELASLFRDRLQCPDALYLDGAISSVIAPALGVEIERTRMGPVFIVLKKN